MTADLGEGQMIFRPRVMSLMLREPGHDAPLMVRHRIMMLFDR